MKNSFDTLKKVRRSLAFLAGALMACGFLGGCAAKVYNQRTLSGYSKNGPIYTETVIEEKPQFGLYRQIDSYQFQPRTDLPTSETGFQ